jgi:hypothetical protein
VTIASAVFLAAALSESFDQKQAGVTKKMSSNKEHKAGRRTTMMALLTGIIQVRPNPISKSAMRLSDEALCHPESVSLGGSNWKRLAEGFLPNDKLSVEIWSGSIGWFSL